MMQLIREVGYDAITVQDILDRAIVGRATFYAHYQSKEDLFLAHHSEFSSNLGLGRWTPEQLLSVDPPESLIRLLEQASENRALYHVIVQSRDGNRIWKGLKAVVSSNLAHSLSLAYGDVTPRIPLDVLTEYMASAQLALLGWWMEQRTPYTAQQIGTMIHRLQRAAIQDAFDPTG
jgi:AcrR family transcriptional regulator